MHKYIYCLKHQSLRIFKSFTMKFAWLITPFYFLLIISKEGVVLGSNFGNEDFMDLHVLRPPEFKITFLTLGLCVYVSVCLLLA